MGKGTMVMVLVILAGLASMGSCQRSIRISRDRGNIPRGSGFFGVEPNRPITRDIVRVTTGLGLVGAQLLIPIRQAILMTMIGRGLTCSNPSPNIDGFDELEGASVTSTCNGVTASTTTDEDGEFRLLFNFTTPITPLAIRTSCPVVLTVPEGCDIAFLFAFRTDRPKVLRSTFLYLDSINTTVPGGSAIFRTSLFYNING